MVLKSAGVIDRFVDHYRFLSNFAFAEVTLDGEKYPTVEHAYQAAKTTDKEVRLNIKRAKTPGRAKQLGRRIVLRNDWDNEFKLAVMEDLLLQKFTKNEILRQRLVETGQSKLIEGNFWGDEFWGVCNGKGKNHLGRLLMKVRDMVDY